MAFFAPAIMLVITFTSGPRLRNSFADFDLEWPLISTIMLDPVVPGVATALALVSMTLTLVFSLASSRRLSSRWNQLVLLFWGLFVAVYFVASVLPLVTLIEDLS